MKIIGNSAFESCWEIESVIIPDKVESIGRKAFYNCTKLKSVKLGSGVKSIDAIAFERCPELSEFIVDEKNEHIKFVDGILFNSDESSIICCIFDNDKKPYVIPDGIESIEESAFTNCHFKTVTIPDSVKKIGEKAFYGSDLESITIPVGIETIELATFGGCKNLEYVTIPATVKSIEKGAFEDCTSLETINFTGTPTQWNAVIRASGWNKGCPSTMKINFNYQE